MVSNNKLGRKTGAGLYQRIKYDNDHSRQTVYDINAGIYREVIPYVFPFADKMKRCLSEGDYQEAFDILINNHLQEANICLGFLLRYIVYSLYAAKEVGFDVKVADDVMAAGYNWCPPLAMIQALSSVTDVNGLIKERVLNLEDLVDIDALFVDVKPSKYDYRLYFKSERKLG